jgi:glucose/arabinose dehydrogenase
MHWNFIHQLVHPTARRWVGALATPLAIGLGVGSVVHSSPPITAQTTPSPQPTLGPAPSPVPTPPISQQIPTALLTPQPLKIDIEQLPLPHVTPSVSQPPTIGPILLNSVLQVPAGFGVNVFAADLDAPRWLALTPKGEVLVTETRQNRIRLLSDPNRDGVADSQQVFATAENGLFLPLGMAFVGDSFFVGNTNAVLRFPYTIGQTQLVGPGVTITDLPGEGYNQHWTRNVVRSPDGKKLFVAVGSQTNAEIEPLPRASVQVMNVDGSDRQTFAWGLRNPVGLDFHPVTGELYTTVNERDGLGDDLVPDYLTRLQAGEFYGWPYTYLKPSWLDPRHTLNGVSVRPDLAIRTRLPDVLFAAHSAPLGLQFYRGKTFPMKYRDGAFVAFRGSWNRSQGTGYKIVFVPFGPAATATPLTPVTATPEVNPAAPAPAAALLTHRPLGHYEDFLTGFLLDPTVPMVWGRPVGLLAMPDGSLLFTDETNNRIYRIQYYGN